MFMRLYYPTAQAPPWTMSRPRWIPALDYGWDECHVIDTHSELLSGDKAHSGSCWDTAPL